MKNKIALILSIIILCFTMDIVYSNAYSFYAILWIVFPLILVLSLSLLNFKFTKHNLSLTIGYYLLWLGVIIPAIGVTVIQFENYQYQWFGRDVIRTLSFGTALNIIGFSLIAGAALIAVSTVCYIVGLFLKPKEKVAL